MTIKATTTLNTNMKEWYKNSYPDDDCAKYMSDTATFQGLFDALDFRHDVYKCIGVGDSIIRERIFSALATIIGTSYEYVYEQWMLA